MTKAQQTEREEAIAQLREWIKPGDTVYTILEHVSRSGMSRTIRVVVPYTERTYPNFTAETGQCAVECECTFGRGTHGDFLAHHDPIVRVDFVHPNYAVGKALGLRHGKHNGHQVDGLVIGGCGMDMGFHLVYELSSVLYPEYACLGKNGKCPSSYHVNHRDTVQCEGTMQYNPDGPNTGERCRWNGRTWVIGDERQERTCPICKGKGRLPNPDGPERWDLVHTDGYALRQRWL